MPSFFGEYGNWFSTGLVASCAVSQNQWGFCGWEKVVFPVPEEPVTFDARPFENSDVCHCCATGKVVANAEQPVGHYGSLLFRNDTKHRPVAQTSVPRLTGWIPWSLLLRHGVRQDAIQLFGREVADGQTFRLLLRLHFLRMAVSHLGEACHYGCP